MDRRRFLSALGACTLAARTAAPQTAFPGTAYRDYSRCLPDYLRALAARAYRVRNDALAGLTTPEAARARQRWARQTFWRLVGGMPERTPLNARVVGSLERKGYRLDKVVYESRPNLHVTANLYIPTEGSPPFPGVLFQMGHSMNGKASLAYQRCCQGLARLGFLVLAFDPMAQGERIYYYRQGTSDRPQPMSDQHSYAGKQMLLLGDTASRFQVWDAVRSLDYLASHPLVDPKRLASTGQSGGGTLTQLLACVDDRLSAAVVCAGNTENFACAGFDPPGSTDDAEQNFIGSGPLGFDRWDLLYPLAPKPLLIVVSDKDFFGTYSPAYISSGWEEYQKLKRVYKLLGKPERLGWADSPLPHSLAYDSRLHVYNWLARWLEGESKRIEEEPPTEPEADQTLWVSDMGNVVKAFRGETPFTLNKNRNVVRQRMALDTLLGVTRPTPGTRFAVLGRASWRDIWIEAVEAPSAPGLWLPAWIFLPKVSDPSRPVLLLLETRGRNPRGGEGELFPTLAAAGTPVCAADVRGIGDLRPEVGRHQAWYALSHNSDDEYAWASMALGKPLLGQRVTDILALAAALRAHPGLKGRPLVLAAEGNMTAPAEFAAALDPLIPKVYLAGPLMSYQNIVESEYYSYSFTNYVPNLLLHTDLPEVVASIAPRKVVLAGAVDANNRRLNVAAVEKVYASATNVEILPAAGWDYEALSRICG